MKLTKQQLKEIIKEELDEGINSFMDKYVNRPKGTTFEFGPPKLGAPARRYSAARRRRKEKEAEKEEPSRELNEAEGELPSDEGAQEAAFEKLRESMGLMEQAMLYMYSNGEDGQSPVEIVGLIQGILSER